MDDDPLSSQQEFWNRFAVRVRDGILLLLVLLMVAWLVWVATTSISTSHLDLTHRNFRGKRWFAKPLNGTSAIVAGCSFLSLAAALLSLIGSHPWFVAYVPWWLRKAYWLFFPGWAIGYFAAIHLAG